MPRAFTDLRPDERYGAATAFLTLFGILAGHTLLETARDALFLARLPATQLPWVYLAMAGLAVLVSQGSFRPLGRLQPRSLLSLLLLATAGVTFGFWLLDCWDDPWMLRALYVWSGVAGTLSSLQFWMTAGSLYTITQAKRVFRVVATGSVLGAVAGAGLARLLSQHLPAAHLVLAAALAFAVTGLGPAWLLPHPEHPPDRSPTRTPLRGSFTVLRENPYVVRLAGLVLVSSVALTLGDYVFKSTVARHVPGPELGAVFATIYLVLNLAALVIQLFALGWILRVLGLHRSLWVLPGLVMLGAGGVAFGGGLAAALLLKGADGSLRHSLHRTSTELLFLPLPDGLRTRAKPWIDVVGQRGGQALASVLILSEVVLNRGDTVLAAVAAVLCVVWVAWAVDLKPLYLELFRTALREGSLSRRTGAQELDMGSLETLFQALNSSDDAEVVGAMEVLANEGRARLIPALILYHPSEVVVLRALDLLAPSGRTDFLPISERLLSHPAAPVRAAALRARSAVELDEALLRGAGSDPSPLVRATALVGLMGSECARDECQATLDDLLDEDHPTARRALAQAIAGRPSMAFADILLILVDDTDAETAVAAAAAMGALRDERFLPALLPLLARQASREAARRAFLGFHRQGLEFLTAALSDNKLPRQLRRHIPRTLSRFAPREAATALLSQLLPEPDGAVRYKILRGLGRIIANHPEVVLERRILHEATRRTVEATLRILHWRSVLADGARQEPRRASPGHELLVTLLRDKETHAVERVFRLLGLAYRDEDLEGLYRGLHHSNRRLRASSRELLDNLLKPPLREAVAALVDDGPSASRIEAAATFFRPEPIEYEALLDRLLDQHDDTLRALAAYHVGELGLRTLRPRLESFRQHAGSSSFSGGVVERALKLLERPGSRWAHAD